MRSTSPTEPHLGPTAPGPARGLTSGAFARLTESLAERYSIERPLGRGGMATVYLARDLRDDRLVALKVLHPELAASLGGERFLREIRLAARLRHPHVLGLHESGEAGGLLYYVMPYVRGETVRARLDRERHLPVDDALRIAAEVASALAHAHAEGVVHRDVKPENVLLADGRAVVADFGIARAITSAGTERLTETGIALGTPQYMSPEQGSCGDVLPTSDVYALGCVLYEMLVGEPPFSGPNAMAVIAKHAMAEVPAMRVVRPAVTPEVERLVRRALAKSPADRWPSARAFEEAIRRAAAGTAAARVAVPDAAVPHAVAGGAAGAAAAIAAAAIAEVVGRAAAFVRRRLGEVTARPR
jgi:serine/threonine-protein kinase